jgi:hypothetical protein
LTSECCELFIKTIVPALLNSHHEKQLNIPVCSLLYSVCVGSTYIIYMFALKSQ